MNENFVDSSFRKLEFLDQLVNFMIRGQQVDYTLNTLRSILHGVVYFIFHLNLIV
jgi:hypothetical protein